jgi:shikimate dehydrogenase
VRDPARAQETLSAVARHPLAPDLSVSTIGGGAPIDADIVVSTVPADAQTPELLAAFAEVPAVFEVIYDPWPTPLAQSAQDSGRRLVSGLDLLAHQAVLQMVLMTGESVPVGLVRDAGRAELARRAVQNHTTHGHRH